MSWSIWRFYLKCYEEPGNNMAKIWKNSEFILFFYLHHCFNWKPFRDLHRENHRINRPLGCSSTQQYCTTVHYSSATIQSTNALGSCWPHHGWPAESGKVTERSNPCKNELQRMKAPREAWHQLPIHQQLVASAHFDKNNSFLGARELVTKSGPKWGGFTVKENFFPNLATGIFHQSSENTYFASHNVRRFLLVFT